MSEPPRKDSSMEMTAVRPRPPLSDVPGPTPEHMADFAEIERLAALERARRDAAQERPTMMTCPWCKDGLVTPQQHGVWLDFYPELLPAPPSQPDEPVPPSRPEVAA